MINFCVLPFTQQLIMHPAQHHPTLLQAQVLGEHIVRILERKCESHSEKECVTEQQQQQQIFMEGEREREKDRNLSWIQALHILCVRNRG